MKPQRKTQAERRSETHKLVLESASELFGKKGYANTSLEDVASACNLTTRPIYHYFGNKKALFEAVNQHMETRILAAMDPGEGSEATLESWRNFLDLCEDPGFRQIVLVDSPNILGRGAWAASTVSQRARGQFAQPTDKQNKNLYRAELLGRMVMGALAEAALMIAEAEDRKMARKQAEELVEALFSAVASESGV